MFGSINFVWLSVNLHIWWMKIVRGYVIVHHHSSMNQRLKKHNYTIVANIYYRCRKTAKLPVVSVGLPLNESDDSHTKTSKRSLTRSLARSIARVITTSSSSSSIFLWISEQYNENIPYMDRTLSGTVEFYSLAKPKRKTHTHDEFAKCSRRKIHW